MKKIIEQTRFLLTKTGRLCYLFLLLILALFLDLFIYFFFTPCPGCTSFWHFLTSPAAFAYPFIAALLSLVFAKKKTP